MERYILKPRAQFRQPASASNKKMCLQGMAPQGGRTSPSARKTARRRVRNYVSGLFGRKTQQNQNKNVEVNVKKLAVAVAHYQEAERSMEDVLKLLKTKFAYTGHPLLGRHMGNHLASSVLFWKSKDLNEKTKHALYNITYAYDLVRETGYTGIYKKKIDELRHLVAVTCEKYGTCN